MAACILCRAEASRPAHIPPTVFAGERFGYRRCEACGAAFVDPPPGPETLLAMYPPSYQGEDAPPLDGEVARAEVELLARHLPPPARILDYGCGSGTFVARARGRGFAADGVEFNPAYIDRLRENHPGAGFLHVDEVEALPSAGYDALVLSNVLEHLIDPSDSLRGLLRLIRPGGLVYAYGPLEHNASVVNLCVALNYRVKHALRPTGTSSHPPHHLTFTTYESQRDFFQRLALRELHYQAVDNGWPFPRRWSEATGVVGTVKWCLGAASRGLGRVVPRLGNAFVYIGAVPATASRETAPRATELHP